MKYLGRLLLATSFSLGSSLGSSNLYGDFPSSSSKCAYGEPCWPNDAEFEKLAAQVSHPLVYPKPPASACYPPDDPSGDCSAVLNGNAQWRTDQPSAMQSTNFESFIFPNGSISACYLNTTLNVPCTQGSVPVIGVDSYTVEDVQAAVKFASKHDLRLVVRNTGHDFLGRSTARDSFMIWTHHLKNISYSESFVPEGGESNQQAYKALTLGSGVQWHEAYQAARNQGRVIVGGLSAGATVGAAGGWVMGGGHSALSPKYGLGVDNALQFTVVLASGEHVVASDYQNSDLFWALRGGGGGTYGVVTSVTYRTHENISLVDVQFSANFTDPAQAAEVLTEYIQLHPALSEAGWGGYAIATLFSLSWVYIFPNGSVSDVNATFDPFFDHVQNRTNDTFHFSTQRSSFYDWYDIFFAGTDVGPSGGTFEIGSRLIPIELAESQPETVTEALTGVMTISGAVQWNFISGGAVSRADPDSTGLNPGWRTSLAQVAFAQGWIEGASSTEIEGHRENLRRCLDIMDAVGPDSYFNEASLWEKDPQRAFFGDHYERLAKIKSHYDPRSMFIVPLGVGYTS